MFKKFILAIILFTHPGFSQEQTNVYDLNPEDILLLDTFTKARVYVFLSPECPLCQSYSSTLKKLYENYSARGIEFVGVITGTLYKPELIDNYKQKYKIPFPIFIDKKKQLAARFDAKITPEVFVVAKDGSKFYSGRIDNWAYALGKRRKNVTEHDLLNAIEDILNSRPIKISQTKAIGCFIE